MTEATPPDDKAAEKPAPKSNVKKPEAKLKTPAFPGPVASVEEATFEMLPKGGNLWVKNAARESALIAEMRKGTKLVIKADSLRGHESIDTYSLAGFAQAMERLQKIAAMFPGEEERYPRLRNLYELANWWPEGAPKAKPAPPPAAAPPPPPPPPVAQQPEPRQESFSGGSPNKTGTYTAETLRDLSKISEINQKIFRQQTPRAMLNTAVNEVGGYLRAARALAVIGAAVVTALARAVG